MQFGNIGGKLKWILQRVAGIVNWLDVVEDRDRWWASYGFDKMLGIS